jgi:hypothetical protein
MKRLLREDRQETGLTLTRKNAECGGRGDSDEAKFFDDGGTG